MRKALIGCAASAALMAGAASAAPNLVTNGGFETNGGNGQLGLNTTAAGWTVPTPTTSGGSYAFIYNPDPAALSGTSADTTGANGIASPPPVTLWGPDNGGVNSNPATLGLSPGGGAFLASNPAYHNGPISQAISGLTPGAQYILSFDFAGAQQEGFTGATTEGWKVTLGGGAAANTAELTNNSKSFTGWQPYSVEITAGSSGDLLTFLATGGPSETEPPFALLDDVSLVAVPIPEPATWAVMLAGVGILGASLRMRRQQVFTAA